MTDDEIIVIRRSSRTQSDRVAEAYIVPGQPGVHWRWVDE